MPVAGPRGPPTVQPVSSVGLATGGINSVSQYAAMDPGDCIQLQNLIPGSIGRATRLGSLEWQHAVTGTGGVRTIVPFVGVDSTKDKLFCATNSGIYDVTAQGGAPSSAIAFGTTTGNAGFGAWCSFTTVADHFLVYCDEVNGMYTYAESTNTWLHVAMGAGATQIAGVDPTTFVFPVVWQNRLWFCQKGTSDAWYLPVGQVYGTAKVWHFGNNARYGGELKCLAVWTVSGGVSAVNNLVAILAAGEIVVFTGTDPDTAGLFTIVGTWFVGGFPNSRHLALDSGGDVLIMSNIGLVSLARLLQGATVFDRSIYETWKIDNLISQEVAANSANLGWNVCVSPDESAILLTVPQGSGVFTQYAASLQTKQWCQILGRNMQCAAVWHNHLFFGMAGSGSSVWLLTGGQDGVLLNGSGGVSIDFFLFSSFQPYGSPSNWKRAHTIRAIFSSPSSTLQVTAGAKYDYDLSVIGAAPAAPAPSGAVWDTAKWDSDIWGGTAYVIQQLIGAAGMGRMVAIQMRGKANTPLVLNELDVHVEPGGIL